MMKILMVSSYLPYPLHDGGRIRLYNLLKFLKDKHEITLISERTSQTQADIEEVRKVCKKLIVVDRPKTWSVRNVSKSVLSLNPLLTTVHTHKKLKQKITEELNNENFDLIHVETFYVMQNLPTVSIPVVLVEHNVEYLVYEKYIRRKLIPLRAFLLTDVLKLKRVEKYYWKKADIVVAVSPKEQKVIGEKAELVPNGVDTNRFALKKFVKNKEQKKVLFIGNFKWIQNRDSVVYIIKNIWPKISKNKKFKLWIVGKNIPEGIKKLGDESIIFDEHATNQTELIFQEADLLMSPIRVGGGSNFKILESMASGTPVITTALGNEGIEAKNGEEIIICENPEDFANETLKILKDDYLYEKISRNGRKFIEENFDWKNIAEKLEMVYQKAVKK